MVGRGCSVVTSVGLSGSRSLSMDGVSFVESDPVRNDGVDAHLARGVSLFRPRQQQKQPKIRDRRGTSPRLCRAVNRNNASASNRAMSPKQNRNDLSGFTLPCFPVACGASLEVTRVCGLYLTRRGCPEEG